MSRFIAEIILTVVLAIVTAYLTSRLSVVQQMGGWFSKLFSSSTSYSTESVTTMIHQKCRNANYPRSEQQRFRVSDEFVKWETPLDEYNPPSYTSDGVAGKPWADPESIDDPSVFNQIDANSKVDRTSHEKKYKVVDGYPQNPVGRTGIKGRGCLGRWGPNHAADPIVTRWKLNEQDERSLHSRTGLPILQFISIQRKDSAEWAIPGGMVDPGELVTATLKREFAEEALNSLEVDEKQKKALLKKVDKFFEDGFEVYRGYVDDPRNTDNAWMETVAYNFHDDNGDSVGRFNLHAGDDAVGVKWMDIDRNVKLYASHGEMIKAVAEKHKAHW